MKKYKILGSKELPDSEVEIECEIDAETVTSHKAKAMAKIQKGLTLPGFRPGHVPEAMILKHAGELAIFNEMADIAIDDVFPDAIAEAKANFISMPHVEITKMAVGNPVVFKIIGPVMPEIKLPNYKKIAEKVNGEKTEPKEATEKEIEETIDEVRKNYAQRNHTHAEGEEHKEDEKLDLPEVTEEWVKKLGKFETVEDFRNKIKEGIEKEKEFKAKDKKRLAILENIISETKLTLPKLLIDGELSKMEAQFHDDLARAGLKVDDYLKHIKKTAEEMKKEWTPDAEKRAKVQILITKISLEEKIEADKEQVNKEVEMLMKTYKDAKEDRARAYVEMMLTNEKVFEWLENQK